MAENTPQLVKTIYVVIQVDDECVNLQTMKIAGKRYVTIPVASYNEADVICYIWEDAFRNGISLVDATKFIMEKIDYE